MKVKTPIWQRVVCALLAIGGAAALVGEMLSGRVIGLWSILQWLFAACGTFMFASIAIKKDAVYRAVNSLPVPSAQVAKLVEAHQIVSAIKTYRAEAGATLFEAQAVISHYWPNSSSKRTREKPRAA